MDLYLTLIIIITSAIQSLFGVGVLLFGTPLLLLLNYTFFESLMILLPISASINLLQIIKDYKYINFKIYNNILLLTIPFIVIFLYLISKFNINITLFIGIFLIIIAIKDYILLIQNFLNKLLKYNKIFYIVMGIIHGITNLGGALLTAKIFTTDLDKYKKRATIAISYMTFAIFQIITLSYLNNTFNINNIYYILIGVTVFTIINKLFFHKISNHKYNMLFLVFLICTGIALILKGMVY